MENILLQEAFNESTPTERLQELVNSGQEDVCKAVASNPNTAPDLLIQLFRKYPVEVLNNQVLDFILLEIPNFLEQLCRSYYLVFNKEGLPYFFINWASNHHDFLIRNFVADSCYTPADILEKLSQDKFLRVRQTVAHNTVTPTYILEKLASDNLSEVRRCVASNKNATATILEKLAHDNNYIVRIVINNFPLNVLLHYSRLISNALMTYVK